MRLLLSLESGQRKTRIRIDQAIKLTGELFYQEEQERTNAKAAKDRADAAEKALRAQQAEAQRLNQLSGGIGQTISTGIVDALMNAQNATQALGGMSEQAGKQLVAQLGQHCAQSFGPPGAGLSGGLLGLQMVADRQSSCPVIGRARP